MNLKIRTAISQNNSDFHSLNHLNVDSLLNMGELNEKTTEILREAIRNKRNILIVGAIGAGKTVLLQALTTELHKIAPEEMVGIVQTSEEIKSYANHNTFTYPLPEETMPLGKLVHAALRVRSDRIIVGDIYHDEAKVLLNCNIPWIASIIGTTIENGIHNLEQFSKASSYQVNKSQIGEEIDIVALVKKVNGVHKVTKISQFMGYDNKHDIFEQIPLFIEKPDCHDTK